jgi:cell filamentation protein
VFRQRKARAAWEATFIPGTYILANKLGITDARQLQRAEFELATDAELRVLDGSTRIPATYDFDHLKALHRALAGDIYPWAGQCRIYELGRGSVSFAPTHVIDRQLATMARFVRKQPWAELGHDETAQVLAHVYARLNYAHPFRDCNGRAGKLLVRLLAREHGWELDYSRVPIADWIHGSRLSLPDPSAVSTWAGPAEPDPAYLVPAFHRALIEPPW